MRPANEEARARAANIAFWLVVAGVVALKLVLISDLSVQIKFLPHDDSLYVGRAYYLLLGQGYGPYDPRILEKYPGISLWLAAMRLLGIPFLLSVNVLYILSGLYVLTGLLKCGVRRSLAFAAFMLFLFNPITMGYEWVRVIREPLDTGLLALVLGAMLHVYRATGEGRAAWAHLAVIASAFAFSLFMREEDRLLWALLGLFWLGVAWHAYRARPPSRALVAFVVAAALVPAASGKLYEYALRAFAEEHYGQPVLNELEEGEYPRLLAAIRSINDAKDNRLVMVTQGALHKLRVVAPDFAPVIDRLPTPSAGSFSCRIQGVCSEISNGWMPFWIKDAAFEAGLTPTLPAAQAYFRNVREEIERACEAKKLHCTERGRSLIPPMEFRWTRAYVGEAWRLAKMAFGPDPNVLSLPPVTYNVPIDLGRRFQAVTMTSRFDTLWQSSFADRPNRPLYQSPLWASRTALTKPYRAFAALLLIAALVALGIRIWLADVSTLGPLSLTIAVFGIYLLLRFVALSYVAVFMGHFEPRMMFATYALGTYFALPLIACAVSATRIAKDR